EKHTKDSKPYAAKIHRTTAMERTRRHAVSGVAVLEVGAVDDEQPGVDRRYLAGRGDHDIVGSPPPVKLPRGLEQLKELVDRGRLIGLGNDPDHRSSSLVRLTSVCLSSGHVCARYTACPRFTSSTAFPGRKNASLILRARSSASPSSKNMRESSTKS